MELMEFVHDMLTSEDNKDNELEKAQCQSIRKMDEQKEKDVKRKEKQSKLQERSDLLEKTEQLHNRLTIFQADGSVNCESTLSETIGRRLEIAMAIGKAIGLRKKDISKIEVCCLITVDFSSSCFVQCCAVVCKAISCQSHLGCIAFRVELKQERVSSLSFLGANASSSLFLLNGLAPC